MSNSEEQTFDEFLSTTDLRSWDRNYMKWYGSIVLKPAGSPDPFSFTLVVHLTDGHNRGRYLDDKFFWPLLERAESLDVPIYLHPTQPPKPVIEATYSGFSPMSQARAFLDQFPVSASDKEKIAHRNAERLLGLNTKKEIAINQR